MVNDPFLMSNSLDYPSVLPKHCKTMCPTAKHDIEQGATEAS